MRLGSLVFRNIHRHRRSFAFSMVGIVIGVTSFVIFLALGEGLRQNVLERIYVVNQLEVVPRSYEVGAFQGEGTLFGGGTGLDDFTADDLRALPGVVAVYPKMQLAFPSIAAGGEEIFGRRFWTELIADGIPEDLIQSEMPPPDDPLEAFRDWDAEPLPCDAPGEPGRGPAVGCPAGRLCTPQGFCERAACTPSDEVLAAPDRDTAERVQACLERHFQGRAGLGLSLREIPEDRRAPPDEPPFRLAVSPRYLDETRRVLGRTLPAESPPPAPDDEADDADAHEQPDPCDDVPGRDVVTILGGEERTCDDPPSYCTVDTRRCEMPVPVIASPFLFEVFDTNVQTILSGSTRSLPRLTREGLIGFTFDVEMGRGVLGSALRLEDVGRTSRRFRLVGWSPRAMRLGMTMPLGYVRRYNRLYKGDEAAEEYHSILVVTERNEDLASVAEAVQNDLQLSIDDSYEQAKRGSMMITLLTLGLMFISALIISLAALNITHTFLMVIAERRREIGVLRSVGARRRDIRRLVLSEAGLIGLAGAVIAVPAAFGLAALADYLMAERVPDFPFKPDSLFAFEPYIIISGVAIAVIFSLFGAFVPANRASGMDPAEALRGQ